MSWPSSTSRLGGTVLAAVLALLGATGCKHAESTRNASAETQSAGQEIPPPPEAASPSTAPAKLPDLPKSVDAKDLDEAEKKVLFEILSEQFDPCGKSRTFLQGLEAGDCPIAGKLAATLVSYLQQGLSKKQAVAQLLREIERLNTVVQIEVGTSPRKGPADAKIVVIEFSDFECPYCRRAIEPLDRLQKHYGFALVYKFYPLKLSHPNAEGAARAAWAAHQQGKFWEMHDIMFANADHLDWPSVQKLAAKVGLDMKKFVADFESPKSTEAVAADEKAGNAAGVDGTPTFYVSGRKAESLVQVQELVRDLLAAAGQPVPPPLTAADLGEAPAAGAAEAAAATPATAPAPAVPPAPSGVPAQ